MEFAVALERAVSPRSDLRLIRPDEIVAALPENTRKARNALSFKVKVAQRGILRERAVVPDLTFGLALADRSPRYFTVEIDRGTMPIVRSDATQTRFAQKMRGYLSAYAAKQHQRRFGWKSFRVLTVTTDSRRMQSMIEAAHRAHLPRSPGAGLFLFATADELRTRDPLAHAWRDGNGRPVPLI